MKHTLPALLLLVSFALLLTLAAGIYPSHTADSAAFPEPGSPEDPLVTLSMLRDYVQQHAAGGGGTFMLVNASRGAFLEGGAGTEIILRAGTAAAVGNAPGNGLVNITTGANLDTGAALTRNHLLLVPRADGRGARITSATAVFLVRGPHQLR
jgi:hypothetical protein